MKPRIWKRLSASLVAGAFGVLVLSPAGALAATPTQPLAVVPVGTELQQFYGGLSSCLALGSGGLTGAGLTAANPFPGGLEQVRTFGSGGFIGPYYAPSYQSYGYGTVGGFLNYTNGQPSPFATLAGSPQCAGVAGLAGSTGLVRGTPFVIRDSGALTGPAFGFAGAGFGWGLGSLGGLFGRPGFGR